MFSDNLRVVHEGDKTTVYIGEDIAMIVRRNMQDVTGECYNEIKMDNLGPRTTELCLDVLKYLLVN